MSFVENMLCNCVLNKMKQVHYVVCPYKENKDLFLCRSQMKSLLVINKVKKGRFIKIWYKKLYRGHCETCYQYMARGFAKNCKFGKGRKKSIPSTKQNWACSSNLKIMGLFNTATLVLMRCYRINFCYFSANKVLKFLHFLEQ